MTDDVAARLRQWWAMNARDLPWRRDGTTAWGVLVSEFMLQQTPVSRVVPAWTAWMSRWPTPGSLAAEPAGEAVRAWGRLGYPRRALRLHAAATAIVERHAGAVPPDAELLRLLPGVGDYTAAAVAAFAFGARAAVLDTNVRRVYARVYDGVADAIGTPTVVERAAALARVPDPPGDYSVAVMELGALVCHARAPRCDLCPIAEDCRWLAGGRPEATTKRRTQPYAGTDRQARGRLLGVLREASGPVDAAAFAAAWPEREQRERALAGLVEDGLVVAAGAGYELP